MDVHKKWFACSVVAKVLDVATSLYLIWRYGLEIESNPLTVSILNVFGIVPGLILNGIIVSMLFYTLYRYRRKKLLIVSSAMMALIVTINLITIFIS